MDVSIHQAPPDLNLSARQLKKIAINSCHEVHLSPLSLSYIFVSDKELAEMHGTFLHDNSQTDVITFNLGEDAVEGEIYISVDRAKEQAEKYKVTFEEEVIRLMIHGILHLAGYDDIEENEHAKLKRQEDSLVSKMRLHL